jgi:hypothetical protein
MPDHDTSKARYVAIVMLRAHARWLRLPRVERNAFNETVLGPILAAYADRITVRHLDMEAFTGRCSDVALFETADPQDFYFLMEELRDTALFTEPYFEVVSILLGLEDGYRAFESLSTSTT